MAPEILRKQPYDFAVDWWCLGCVIYEMLHGLPPFYSENRAHMYRHILERPLRTRNTLSSSTENILFRLLQKDKINRLGSENDFEEISKHRFFKDIDWIKLLERKLTAPFLPSVTSSTDTRNISPEFVNSAVPMENLNKLNYVNNIINNNVRYEISDSVICSVMRSRNLHGIDETFSGFSYIPTKNIHN
ncbi:unnamed protein product [Schistosoma mattheei]|uniref:Protein kinase domain-containing protein n=1 Tax=Schistosoma mattheei TaxID=31246 RepID=A0A3P8EB89_9TREM|nr:unnamed protein product [Schistosoma mattheei]